jgi:hypothetical protein
LRTGGRGILTCPKITTPPHLEKKLVINYAKRTQLTLGYIFRVGVPASYFNCNSNTIVYTGLAPAKPAPARYVTFTITAEGA